MQDFFAEGLHSLLDRATMRNYFLVILFSITFCFAPFSFAAGEVLDSSTCAAGCLPEDFEPYEPVDGPIPATFPSDPINNCQGCQAGDPCCGENPLVPGQFCVLTCEGAQAITAPDSDPAVHRWVCNPRPVTWTVSCDRYHIAAPPNHCAFVHQGWLAADHDFGNDKHCIFNFPGLQSNIGTVGVRKQDQWVGGN